MNTIDGRLIDQGTPEWMALRLGQVTSSRIADVVARTKTGYGASRANYLAELLCARLTGTIPEGFTSPAMEWGIEHEPEARAAYQFRFNCEVEQIAYAPHPSIPMSGASPDGMVGRAGLVEIKCPNTATHIDTILRQQIPGKYETQMLWQMGCTGRQWCDYVSYDPRVPEDMALFVKRLHRNADRIVELETEVQMFLSELDQTMQALEAAVGRLSEAA